MKIHISKLIFRNHCDINISQMNCTFENIIKAISCFRFNYILLSIDSLSKYSSVFLMMDSLKLSYISSSTASENIEVKALVPNELIYAVLESVVKEDPENLFITNLINADNWRRLINDSPQTLLIREYSDLIIIISRDKCNMFLSFQKKKYDYKEVLKRIKNCLLQ